jgi:hypothetical protein
MMLAPYTSALRMPRARVPERLVKKLTVMGSSGNIHGIRTAAKPPSKPAKNVTHSEDLTGSAAAGPVAGGLAWVAATGVAELAAAGVAAAAGATAESAALAGAASSTGVN